MDIEKFLHRDFGVTPWHRTTLQELKDVFFAEKISEALQNDHTRPHCLCKSDILPQKMIEILPETTVHLQGSLSYKDWKILHLPNVDVERKRARHTYLSFNDVTGPTNFDYPFFHDSVAFLKEINDRMPAWMSEFEQLCLPNADALKKRELKRQELCAKEHFASSFEEQYLLDRISDTLLMTRSSPNAPYGILENLKSMLPKDIDPVRIRQLSDVSVKIDLNNSCLNIFRSRGRWWLNIHFQNYKLAFGSKLLTKELLQQIDSHLPAWLSEAQQLLYDTQKKEKVNQVGRNSIRLVVKQRMKEMGWEYRLSTVNDNLLLIVKLQKMRMLKVTLPANNMERAKRLLDELANHMAAIDSVPMNFRIANQSNKIQWEKEN